MRPLVVMVALSCISACTREPAANADSAGPAVADTLTAVAAATGATNDSVHHAVEARMATAAGVDLEQSSHVFESLPDGGRIVLLRRVEEDTAGVRAVRTHLRDIADGFKRGDFHTPEIVHDKPVPGTAVMTARAGKIRYEVIDRSAGAEIRISTTDPVAVAAVHEFLAFQRADHRAPAHEGHHGGHRRGGGG